MTGLWFGSLGFGGYGPRCRLLWRSAIWGYAVGEYFVDILVEDVLMVELKCVERLANEHTAQCLNYLRASGLGVCLLVNFQRAKVEWRRIRQTSGNGHG